jgi:hypothetical protein
MLPIPDLISRPINVSLDDVLTDPEPEIIHPIMFGYVLALTCHHALSSKFI